ncbi:MAG TPA: 2-phosphosulfolactate phosphatase [Longimicrobiaceae bacterium]|nr:2-phosphosulfolactate phosphatase [Longimicrobiaceae bacterium]
MRLDVYLTPGEITPADLADRAVVVIDILRATTTIVQALSSGAKSIYPVASIEEALRLANNFGRDEVLLCGERKCLPIEGFDLGNSPREFTPDRVAGKTLVMSTTNGTMAMSMTGSAARVTIGALLNLGTVVEDLAASGQEPVFLCSGREKHFALEDTICAGLMAERLIRTHPGEWSLNDGARAAMALARELGASETLFEQTAAGRGIIEAGLDGDLAFCARTDVLDILPVLHERNITLNG